MDLAGRKGSRCNAKYHVFYEVANERLGLDAVIKQLYAQYKVDCAENGIEPIVQIAWRNKYLAERLRDSSDDIKLEVEEACRAKALAKDGPGQATLLDALAAPNEDERVELAKKLQKYV